MDQETPAQRNRRLARERKRRQRQREAEHKEVVGAREVRYEFYRSTYEALQRICDAGGYEEEAEAITLLIHGADELRQRDPSRFKEIFLINGHAKSTYQCN